jgi:hypothetical protein
MWTGLPNFAKTACKAYRLDVWTTQPGYVECWLEKDALSGIFEDVLNPYGITLNVGRGYDGWDSIHNAAERYGDGGSTTVLYFGDFDPSGEDMVRSLRERLGFFQSSPEIIKCALTDEDVTRYNLPPDFTKTTDTRRTAFIAKYGDRCVELDALPVNVLRERVLAEAGSRMDMAALESVHRQEAEERRQLSRMLSR